MEAKEKERKKIVKRNKLELIKFKRSKVRQDSIEKFKKLTTDNRKPKIIDEPKIIIHEQEEIPEQNDVEVEVYDLTEEVTQTNEEKGSSSKKKDEFSLCTNINESSI